MMAGGWNAAKNCAWVGVSAPYGGALTPLRSRRSLFWFAAHALGACVGSQPHVQRSAPEGRCRSVQRAPHRHLMMSEGGGGKDLFPLAILAPALFGQIG